MKFIIANPFNISKDAIHFLTMIGDNVAEELKIGDKSVSLDFIPLDDNTGGQTDGRYNDPWKVNINIDGKPAMTLKKTAFALGHELVHVKQHVKGEFSTHRGYVMWKGQKIPNDLANFVEMGIGDPRLLPWETEAYGRMKALTQRAFKKLPQCAQEFGRKFGNTPIRKVVA